MMRNGINILPLIIFLCASFAFLSQGANAQTYLPVGPQTNVPESIVTGGGWKECFRNLYVDTWDIDQLLANCPGTRLMLACRPVGSFSLALLAQANREDVIFDTGVDGDSLHVANGTGWYFSESFRSWGFVRAGDTVQKDNCDIDTSGTNDERLCWHVNDPGYRCGANINLNESSAFERIVYSSSSTPIPTLSEWSLIAMAGILGLAGLLVARRRKAAA